MGHKSVNTTAKARRQTERTSSTSFAFTKSWPPSLSSKKLETKNQEKKEKREREGEEEGARRRHEVEKERQSERSGAPLVLLLLRRKLHFSLSGVSLVSPVVRGFIRIFCSPLVIII